MPYIIVILLLIFAVFYKQEVIKEIEYVFPIGFAV